MASGSHLAFFLCLTSALMISGTVASCPRGWKELGSRCILVVPSPTTFDNAEAACEILDGHLVSIHSQGENDFIRDLIKETLGRTTVTWIGLTDARREGQWIWTDGSSTDFFDWSSGQPDNRGGNEDCAAINFKGRQWDDGSCEATKPFVCARSY